MKILVVYTHPNPASFNAAILEALVDALGRQGHELCVRDLYAESFDPLLGTEDLAVSGSGCPPLDDVLREQELVSWAEALVFIYPLWWCDRPAILKGWFDRVFTNGFAFRYSGKGLEGLLTHRKALVLVTTGGTLADFESISARDQILHPTTECTLRFCGIDNVVDRVFFAVPLCSDAQRSAMLEEVRRLADEF